MNRKEKIKFFRYLAGHFDSMDYPPIILWAPVRRRLIEQGWIKRALQVQRGTIDHPGLYVHVPYCQTKCFFCKFRVRVGNSRSILRDYLLCLKREIKQAAPPARGLSFKTLYLGGGTPTIFSAPQLDELLGALGKHFDLSGAVQKLIEATPATLSREKFKVLKKHGINRVTIGVQSADDKVLKAINRPNQDRKVVLESFRMAREAGIEILNTDLVAGLPSQNTASFLSDVRMMSGIRPQAVHLFPYEDDELVILCKMGKKLTGKDRARRDEMMRRGGAILTKNGYRPYPNEPYLLSPGASNMQFQNRYLYNGSLLGLGAEALSYVPGSYAYENVKLEQYLKSWLSGKAPEYLNGYRLNRLETMLNYVINNIRQGVNKERFLRLYGSDFESVFHRALDELKALGRIKDNEGRAWLEADSDLHFRTYSKFFFSDAVIAKLRRRVDG